MRAKQVYEFTRGGDPLSTLGIGYKAKIHKFFDELDIDRDDYTIKDKQIIFSNHLSLFQCISLVKLPDNLTVSDYLSLQSCINLKELPNDLKVGNSLNLYKCTSLVELPDNLIIGGWLDLGGCISLIKLPNNLTVNGNLYLGGCTKITKLPDDLKVKNKIQLTHIQPELTKWIKSSKFKNKLIFQKN